MDCVSDFFAVDFGDDFELNGNIFFTAFQNLWAFSLLCSIKCSMMFSLSWLSCCNCYVQGNTHPNFCRIWFCEFFVKAYLSYPCSSSKSPFSKGAGNLQFFFVFFFKKFIWSCQYLFVDSQQVIKSSSYSKFTRTLGASRTPPQFSRMLFNTQIIPHYKNTFSVRRSINQYQSIFCANNLTPKSSLFVQENVRLQWLNEYPNLIILSKRQNKVSIHALSFQLFSSHSLLILSWLWMGLQSWNIWCITIISFMKLHRSIVGDINCSIQTILVESVKLGYVIHDLAAIYFLPNFA